MRRAWLLATILLLAAPAASQELVQGIKIDVWQPLDLVNATLAVDAAEVGLGSCFGGEMTVIEGGIDFDEAPEEQGCGTATLVLTVPVGAVNAVVSFNATRRITFDGPSQLTVSARMQQDLLTTNGNLTSTMAVWSTDAGPQTAPTRHRTTLPLDATQPLQLQWLFADRGGPVTAAGAPLPSGQRFGATVTDGEILFHDAQGIQYTMELVDEQEEGQFIRETHALEARLEAPVGATILDARITVADSLRPVSLDGPDGAAIDLETVTQQAIGPSLTLGLPPSLLAQHGAGTYTFHFETLRVAPPPPPPIEPARLPWLFWLMFTAPTLVGVASFGSAFRLVRAAEGRYLRLAWGLTVVIAVLLVYHIATWVYAASLPRNPFITPGALSGAAKVLYVQAVIVLVMLALLGFWAGRSVMRAMRQDLEERQRRELELRRSNQELERFAYVASHDLQEPLRKIAGATQMLERRYGSQFGPDADKWIGYSVDGAKRMQALIQGLLQFSRADRAPMESVPIDLEDAMQNVLDDLEERISEAQGTVSVGPLPTVKGDPVQVRQILTNLVGNAVKYHEPGRPPEVEVSARPAGNRVVIVVADNGIGIPADKREEVFQIFRRLHARHEYEGTGIGLALVQKLVERHGGRIRLHDNNPHGTVFEFDLEAA